MTDLLHTSSDDEHRAGRADGKPLTVLQVLPSINQGAMEREALEIAEAVVEAGGRALVASAGGRMASWFRQQGAELFTAPLDRRNPLTVRSNARFLERLIRAEGVDVVDAFGRAAAWSALKATRRAGVPLATTWGALYDDSMPFQRRFNSVMAAGDAVVAVSEFIADHIIARHPQAAERVEVIHRGVDLDIFNEATVTSERVARLAETWRMADDSRPVFLLPQLANGCKGGEGIIEAAGMLREELGPNFLVLITADGRQASGAYFAKLEAKALKRGVLDCLSFVGPCSDMAAAYRLASCVISVASEPEAFSRTLIEAQAMARPVIAPDHGCAREVVSHNTTGWLTPPGDPQVLAEAMYVFLHLDEGQAEHMGSAGRGLAHRYFSVNRMREGALGVYERLAGRGF